MLIRTDHPTCFLRSTGNFCYATAIQPRIQFQNAKWEGPARLVDKAASERQHSFWLNAEGKRYFRRWPLIPQDQNYLLMASGSSSLKDLHLRAQNKSFAFFMFCCFHLGNLLNASGVMPKTVSNSASER